MRALEALLQHKDFDAISIADLAAEAGVAVGTVYRRFENKEALIPLLFELWHERSLDQRAHAAVTEDELQAIDLRTLLRRQMRAAYRFILQQRHILRAVHLYGRLRPDLLGDEWKGLWTDARTGSVNFVKLVLPDMPEARHERAAEMLVYLANTALVEKGLFGEDGAGFILSADNDAFADEIADVTYAFLMLQRDEKTVN